MHVASEEALGGFGVLRVAAPVGLPSLQATNLERLQANRFGGWIFDAYIADVQGSQAVTNVAKAKPKLESEGKSGN